MTIDELTVIHVPVADEELQAAYARYVETYGDKRIKMSTGASATYNFLNPQIAREFSGILFEYGIEHVVAHGSKYYDYAGTGDDPFLQAIARME